MTPKQKIADIASAAGVSELQGFVDRGLRAQMAVDDIIRGEADKAADARLGAPAVTPVPVHADMPEALATKLANPAQLADPRDPDPSQDGIFRDHNCWRCDNGTKPCVIGNPHKCEYPHARND